MTHVRVSHKDLLNKDGNVQAEPKAKNLKNLPKLPIECPNCQNLFEDEDKLIDHVETCSAPPEPEIDPLISAPTTKQCSFCDDLVPKKNLLEHLERCSKVRNDRNQLINS